MKELPKAISSIAKKEWPQMNTDEKKDNDWTDLDIRDRRRVRFLLARRILRRHGAKDVAAPIGVGRGNPRPQAAESLSTSRYHPRMRREPIQCFSHES
jgi:hypothetical protein